MRFSVFGRQEGKKMLKDITIGQYINGDSFIHKMDPRSKILVIMLYMIALFIVNNVVGVCDKIRELNN